MWWSGGRVFQAAGTADTEALTPELKCVWEQPRPVYLALGSERKAACWKNESEKGQEVVMQGLAARHGLKQLLLGSYWNIGGLNQGGLHWRLCDERTGSWKLCSEYSFTQLPITIFRPEIKKNSFYVFVVFLLWLMNMSVVPLIKAFYCFSAE